MAETRWQVTNRNDFRCRCWNDEYVVYNPVTGDTHLVDRVGGGVLALLAASPSPRSLEELKAELVSHAGSMPDAEALTGILDDFHHLRLIEAIHN